ncbi:MAG: single-stranded-DNA-specific exonuclease RecJ [Candidatus Taylorbacteria bacterium RIFCSPHIGHO2_02_FULL_44_36]|uniref:Single-stranded-DNA-specific exonuclease RecJ n=1 Tax=Candidatus Taylorbacteria bacterium RIFCSPLOWO2_12_FULL_44_15c TaxID=1802333 RepID=A0A1G2P4X3_9BACT|nr:MAG: single-stranded-DNA-specific exonuclease RecJ [Candidatus Taylorbacteria bacterium RIFCSPHIGHO2_02_FULL_44_36]OHA38169.1 MAG: single-stranded-DNA-specific exonuclease RecJ [Candidatus Taylorbacteria bacterium RIFCSPLOWO2_02_FULL_44_35]OHA43313.1 MAG: single-stranded-DNA-specific exonuclease RecJ [Candidatus Taylorbacteria bacterium RIFCSPLOWO2_12_FULL_44_15c]
MKQWKIKEEITAGNLLDRLLFQRGFKTKEEAEKFLRVDYEKDIHDPFLMKGMTEAVAKILREIELGEKIVIWSDYDADGIPGAVVLHDFFKKIGYKNFENYIPHRSNEGFGLNLEAVEELSKAGAKLLITIDCGMADVEEVARAKERDIDVIITDHHEPNGEIPSALAILNPKQKDCRYPDKNLCGAGVAFKLVQALLTQMRRQPTTKNQQFPTEGWEKWLLDMVGIATLSDMVPLVGENRALAHYGLLVLRKSPRLGLQQLLRRLKINQRFLTEDDVGFMITPRLNAASRMGQPLDAFKLLVVADEVEASRLATHLDKINQERKGVVAAITKEVRKIMLARPSERRVIVIGNPDWRPALLGLVANVLKEEHGKPVFLWGRDDNAILKGSCRSDGVNVMELMTEAREVFVEFGGHSLSGGFTVIEEKIHILEEELDRAFGRLSPQAVAAGGEFLADAALALDEVDTDTYGLVEKLAPFGVGNPKPIFLLKNVSPKVVRQFGKEGNHLEIVFENSVGEAIKAIGFFQTTESFSQPVRVGKSLNLAATLEKSYFRQPPEIRLRLVDIF